MQPLYCRLAARNQTTSVRWAERSPQQVFSTVQKAVPGEKKRRKLASLMKTALRRATHSESTRLRSENEALWAQARNLGQELLATRSRLEIAEAQQNDE